MFKFEKINDELVINIKMDHSMVDDCFRFDGFNWPSQFKEMLLEQIAREIDKYVKKLARESELEWLDNELSKIKIVYTDI